MVMSCDSCFTNWYAHAHVNAYTGAHQWHNDTGTLTPKWSGSGDGNEMGMEKMDSSSLYEITIFSCSAKVPSKGTSFTINTPDTTWLH